MDPAGQGGVVTDGANLAFESDMARRFPHAAQSGKSQGREAEREKIPRRLED